MGFSDRLREARKRQGLSQKALAERAKTRTMTINSWESGGSKRPDQEILARVAKALDVSVGWLLAGDEAIEGPRADPPALSRFLETLGDDVTEEELDELRRLRFKGDPTVKSYHFMLMAIREAN
ncbi:MAG: helix-turn-helix transcriptional regulator [Myxococcota bacterium]